MKSVDEVYPFSIVSSIGPTGTIKRLFRNRDYFKSRGYDMTIFANHPAKKGLSMLRYDLREMTDASLVAPIIVSESGNQNGLKKSWFPQMINFVQSHRFMANLFAYRNVLLDKAYIKNYIRKGRTPDIIVFHDFSSVYYYQKYRREKTARIIQFVHADGNGLEMFLKSNRVKNGSKAHKKYQRMWDEALGKSDQIVFISKLAAIKFSDANPLFAHKTAAVVNGIDDIKPDTNVTPSSPFSYRLVSTGGISHRKGQYIVIEAMHRMKPDILAKTHYTIIGTGPDHVLLMEKAKSYGLEKHISFLGNRPNSEIHNLLSGENIYILMSNNEGLPISILEAMRAGLPIISTPVAGIPEEVDERNGFLLSPDVEHLLILFNKLPKYDWKKLGEASRIRFEQEFTFDIMKKKYADIFDKQLF